MNMLFSSVSSVRNVRNLIASLIFVAFLTAGCAMPPRYYKAGSGAKADKFPSFFQVRLVNNSQVPVTVFENGLANQGDLVTALPPGAVETIHVRANYMETPSVDVVLHARAEGFPQARVTTRNFNFNNYRWSIYGGQGFGTPSPQTFVWEFTNWEFGLRP